MGTDHRAFDKIKLPKNHTHLAWLKNEPKEELSHYARRMAQKITHDCPSIIGLSFGGMVAQEIAANRPIREIILISSIKSEVEKPWYMSLAGFFHLPELVPNAFFNRVNKIIGYAFSLVNEEQRLLLNAWIENASPQHLKWAMQQIATWKGVKIETPIYHIHSKSDRLFSANAKYADEVVSGGHLAVYTHSDELNQALQKYLKN